MSERRSLPWPGSADYLRRRAVFLASSHVSARFPATVASRKRGYEEAREARTVRTCETNHGTHGLRLSPLLLLTALFVPYVTLPSTHPFRSLVTRSGTNRRWVEVEWRVNGERSDRRPKRGWNGVTRNRRNSHVVPFHIIIYSHFTGINYLFLIPFTYNPFIIW